MKIENPFDALFTAYYEAKEKDPEYLKYDTALGEALTALRIDVADHGIKSKEADNDSRDVVLAAAKLEEVAFTQGILMGLRLMAQGIQTNRAEG